MRALPEFMTSGRGVLWSLAAFCLASSVWAGSVSSVSGYEANNEWQTRNHGNGMCAMVGVCGKRQDGDGLNCPKNIPAVAADEALSDKLRPLCPSLWSDSGGKVCCSMEQVEAMEKGLRMAEVFIIGCPACAHNFKHFFCTLFCSPDQASFTNVSEVQQAFSNGATAVKTVEFFLSENFKKAFYDSCKDVIFSTANQKAMTYIGGMAKNPQDFIDFLGMVKDKKPVPVGSPIQLDFPVTDPPSAVPAEITPFDKSIPTCWDPAFRCSCGDCPDAPACAPPPPPRPQPTGPPPCAALGLGATSVTCLDVAIWVPGLLLIGALVILFVYFPPRTYRLPGVPLAGEALRSENENGMEEPLLQDTPGPNSIGSVHLSEGEPESSFSPHLDAALPAVEARIQGAFRWLGLLIAQSPLLILLGSLTLVAVCMAGLVNLRVVTEPLRLWVAPGSQAARDKAAYDAAFGPFYRIEQIIISTPRAANGSQASILANNTDAIELVFDIHEALHNLTAHRQHRDPDDYRDRKSKGKPVKLQDVCYKPFGDTCAVESIAQYWQLDRGKFEHRQPTLQYCLSHWSTACRSTFEAPMDPKLILGGFPTDASFSSYVSDTTALLITMPLNATAAVADMALQWEAAFLKEMEETLAPMVRNKGFEITYSSERSVQDELDRESYTDAVTVSFSYVAMFAYIAFAMMKVPKGASWLSALVYSRAGLSASGVGIVLCSVLGALGLCSMLGVWSTLIIMEVIPFLVLAVGVDNMFILALLDARQPAGTPLPERIANTLGGAGPSILLASTCEAVAFGVAATAAMPAVRNFALCAMVAVILDFVLQVTAFMAILAMDTVRMERGIADCIPCLEIGAALMRATPARDFEVTDSLPHSPTSPAASSASRYRQPSDHTALQRYMRTTHAPCLARPLNKLLVLAGFTVLTLVSLTLMQRIEVGLDLAVALPRDSYLQRYYQDVLEYARIGPPVMFVIDKMDLNDNSPDPRAVCASAGCNDDSVVNQIAAAARQPSVSYLASPAASWLDDFLAWVQPELANCCRSQPVDNIPQYCPPPDQPPCSKSQAACAACSSCLADSDLQDGWPTLEDTKLLLPWFLGASPSADCAKGGRGVYTDQMQTDPRTGDVVGLAAEGEVTSSFRAFSAPLSHQSDFVGALRATRELVKKAQATLESAHARTDEMSPAPTVYAYSVFHPFFEQYLTIVGDAARLLALACAAVFLIIVLVTGSMWLAALVFLCLGLMLVDMMGAMALMGVQLNAISLVNLAMSMGIGVEFMAHVAHSYRMARGSREKRVAEALVDMGASVCSGILFTKLVGVAVLAFSRTQVFEVYYFRMFISLVVLGGAHGLVLLPVLLSLIGPPELQCRASSASSSRLELRPQVTHRQPVFIHRHMGSRTSLHSDTHSGSNTSRASGPSSDGRDERYLARGNLVLAPLRSPSGNSRGGPSPS